MVQCRLATPTSVSMVHPLLRRQHLMSTPMPSPGSGHRAASVSSAASTSQPSTSSSTPGGHSTQSITISHVNINSITSRCRLDELSIFSSLNDIDVICLSETKLDDQVNPSLFILNNYHEPLTKHRDRKGGGVAIYVRNNIAVKRLHHLEIDGIEWIWCLIKIKSITLIICSLYLPPKSTTNQHSEFLQKFSECITLAELHSPDNILILGDFNAGNTFLNPKFTNHSQITPNETALHDEVFSLNLKQLICEPTRYTDTNKIANLRDLVIVSNDDMVNKSGVLPSFSNIDHLPTFVSLKINRPSTIRQTTQIWDYKNMDPDKLTRRLMDTDWDGLMDCDIDEATDNFTHNLMTAAIESIPVRTISKKEDDKPWFSSELKREIRKRDRLFRAAKKSNTEYDWGRWRKQRNLATCTNQRLKNAHIQTQVMKLLETKKNPHQYHNILKGLMGRKSNRNIPPLITQDGTPVTDDADKATIFNKHFASQTRLDTHDKPIPHITPPEHPVPSLAEVRVTEPEVLKILNRLDTSKSTGPDKVPNKLLKMCALIIAKPLSKLFNKSLQSGKFPSSWKKACVTPIFKRKGSNSDPTNYRPISLLPNISKILEKLVFNKIYGHIVENELLSEKQSGYRPNHSTDMQLLYLTHQLYSTLNKKENFTAVFLDISKYFDKIWHDGLIEKCKTQYRISGSLLEWLISYLKDRTQVVRVGNSFSTPEKILSGCPQGSVLGPLLAIMYLNDLSKITHNEALFYADDTSLYSSHSPDSENDRQLIQNDLDAIGRYGEEWAITFNAQKTVQMTFTNKHDNQDFKLFFNDQEIPTANKHKHLGLILSSDLNFHEHVNSTIRTINAILGPIYPLAKFLSRPILNNIYTTYIRPYFDYCDIIYDGNLTISDSIRLQTLQNRCARLVTGALFRSPTTALLKDLGWERLETRRLIHKLLFFHRLYYDHPPLPVYVKNMLTDTRQDATGLRLRNANLLSIPPTKLSSFNRSYIPSTIRQWNFLPEDMRNIESRSYFARQVWQRFGTPEPPPLNSYGTKTGNTHHTRLRLGLTKLNAHQFQFQQQQIPSPACTCGYLEENTEHYILFCPLYDINRSHLFSAIKTIVPNFDSLPAKTKIDVILFGKTVNGNEGITIAQYLQTYIQSTRRFATPI